MSEPKKKKHPMRVVTLEELKRMSPEARYERGLRVIVNPRRMPIAARHVAKRLDAVQARPLFWRLLTRARLPLVRARRWVRRKRLHIHRQTWPWFDTW